MKILLSILALVLVPGCGAIHGVPVLTALDSMGRGAAQVLGWCENNGVDQTTVQQGYAAIKQEDYGTLFDVLQKAMAQARSKGSPVSEETEIIFELTQQALAAQGVEQGMRALSGRNADGSEKTTH